VTLRERWHYGLMSLAILGAILGIGLIVDSLVSSSAVELSVGVIVLVSGIMWSVHTSVANDFSRKSRTASGHIELQRRARRIKRG
jgi:uncharacterized membrane protein HdeD (DUF308 family)